MYKYTIEDGNAIRFYHEVKDGELVVEVYPSGESFGSETEASEWAQSYIDFISGVVGEEPPQEKPKSLRADEIKNSLESQKTDIIANLDLKIKELEEKNKKTTKDSIKKIFESKIEEIKSLKETFLA